MTTKNDRPDDQSWSLKGEIKKRRTEQIIQDLESRRNQTARPVPSTPPARQYPMPDLATLPQAAPPAEPVRPRVRRAQVAVLAGVLMFVVIFAGFSLLLLARKTDSAAPSPTPFVLIKSSASDAINYLKRAGLPVFDVRTFGVPNQTWRAAEEIQFTTQNENGTATFLILSYDSPSKAGTDAFGVTNGSNAKKFNTWRMMLLSNLLVLSSPDSASPVAAEVTNHLTYYLAGSSIAILPTVTLQLPTVTAGASLETSTPILATTSSTEVTPASATNPPTFTRIAPSGTPTSAPTETSTELVTTATGVAANSSAAELSTATEPPLVAASPTAAELPSDGQTPTPIPPEMATLLPPPTVTASGPIILAQHDTIMKFVSAAPPSVGPFTLQRQATSTNQYGAGLVYVVTPGEQIAVSLFITGSAQDALDRYQAEVAGLSGVQPVDLGDAAVIAAGSSQVLAESRYRNVVLVIYRVPGDSSKPPTALTGDQITGLLKALNASIPR